MAAHEDFQLDIAAYALGALSEREAGELREHLDGCLRCREELAAQVAVAEALGRGVPQVSAPPELRRRVLEVVDGEAALFEAASEPSKGRRSARRWSLRPLTVFAGSTALALGIVLGALVIAPGGGSTRVFAASVAAPSRWGGSPQPVASLHESGAVAELVVSRMPAAPPGKVYEVWVKRGRRVEPTDALFDASSAGTATVAVPGGVGDATAVLVTAERRGGARVPTMAPLIIAQLG